MSLLRLERVPIAIYNLGLFGLDHLQLVLQQDEFAPQQNQDAWWVMEGLREPTPEGVCQRRTDNAAAAGVKVQYGRKQ